MRSLIDITDLSLSELDDLIATAEDIIAHPERYADKCRGKKLATLFYEPSTRTRLSFEAAMLELGGSVIGFSDAGNSSAAKGESVADTVRTVECFADIVAMRHFKEGAPLVASTFARIPVINAGDGGHNHPTQTLADLLTIKREKGRLDSLTIGCCGDLKFGRTVHSLISAMSRYKNIRFVLISPEELRIPENVRSEILERKGIPYEETTDLEAAMPGLDILYMTRVQRERFTDLDEYERVKNVYILRNSMLENTKPNLRILHPLPRVNEIAYDVDANEKAYYFQQAQNGLYAREAILCDVLGITLEEVKADSLKLEATEKVSGAVKNITDDLPEAINNFKDNMEKFVNSVKDTFKK